MNSFAKLGGGGATKGLRSFGEIVEIFENLEFLKF